jgi:hypothetical protein
MGSPAHVRNFESVLERLVERGHGVTVLFDERKPGADEAGLLFLDRLSAQNGGVRWELLPQARLGSRGRLRMILEAAGDYLRYFEPPYTDADRLRSRAVAFLPTGLERALAAGLRSLPRLRRLLGSGASRVARALGDPANVRRELEARRPGAMIVTPLVQFRTRQRSWVRVAGKLGIGTVACAYSWDSLTNRGLMHAAPQRVVVWNEAQRAQAADLHGIPQQSIVVAGAWPYDHWFDWPPSRSREEFLQGLQLSPERATVLYACSSAFIVGREREAVEEWVCALRSAADSRVATANVIVRPHPLNAEQWVGAPLADAGSAIFPPSGVDPVDEESRRDYFDSIAFADAVVGVNTSALIESAILDRPALAFPGPRFRSGQEELPHFRLLVGDSGAVQASRSMNEHLVQLAETLADPEGGAARRRRFVTEFIRPRGARRLPWKSSRPSRLRRAPSSSPEPGRPAPGSSPLRRGAARASRDRQGRRRASRRRA